MATPNPKNANQVVVQKGDTLSQIAADNNMSLKQLLKLNPTIANTPKYQGGNMIWSGTKVNIAPATPAADTTFKTPMTISGVVTTTPTTSVASTTPTTSTTTTTPVTTTTTTTTTPTTSTTTTEPTTSTYTYSGPTGTSPDQVGGGGATGAMPGGATAFSGGFTQADIDKAFKAGQDATAAQVAADKLATKVKAIDKMIATFKANGIDDAEFSNFISSQIMNDVSQEDTLLKLYDQPAYKARFPGMDALRKKNRTITEAQYIGIENQMVQTLKFFDLPTGFYDNREMLGKIIGNEVSAKEVQDRAQAAQDLAKATNPEVRNALKDFYNIGEGDITAYLLNADIAAPLVLKRARAAEIAGLAKTAGFNAFDALSAEALATKEAYSRLNMTDLATGIGKAGVLAGQQRRLAYLEDQTYSDAEALSATMEADQQAILESQKRAAREAARFSGSTGVANYSLRSNASGI